MPARAVAALRAWRTSNLKHRRAVRGRWWVRSGVGRLTASSNLGTAPVAGRRGDGATGSPRRSACARFMHTERQQTPALHRTQNRHPSPAVVLMTIKGREIIPFTAASCNSRAPDVAPLALVSDNSVAALYARAHPESGRYSFLGSDLRHSGAIALASHTCTRVVARLLYSFLPSWIACLT